MNNYFLEIQFVCKKEDKQFICYTQNLQIASLIKNKRNLFYNYYEIKSMTDTRLGIVQFYNIDKKDKKTYEILNELNRNDYIIAIGPENILYTEDMISKISAYYTLDMYNDTKLQKISYTFLNYKIGKYCEFYLYSHDRTWQRKNLKNKDTDFKRNIKKFKNDVKDKQNGNHSATL